MIMSIKYCKPENEFHIPLLGEPVPTFVGRIKACLHVAVSAKAGVGLLIIYSLFWFTIFYL